jgi:solute carrier family 35 protein E1
MPLFTVLLTKLLYNTIHTQKTYISLIIIITGVAIASLNELNFNILGLATALLSTLAFSLQKNFSKKVLQATKLYQFELLYILARLSLLFYFPIWILLDFNFSFSSNELFLLLLDGLLAFLQNLLAFSVLKILSPLTYSVANASKRIFVILLSVAVFSNEIGFLNFIGMVMAVGGVFLYNQSKFEKKREVLPLNNNNYI